MPRSSAIEPVTRWRREIGLVEPHRPADGGLLRRIGRWRRLPPDPDPVSLAALAIERLGPAAVRAAASGVEVYVAVPDEATAAVFRAALAVTAQRRRTDRLVRIVVD